jgi:hypothetical protein
MQKKLKISRPQQAKQGVAPPVFPSVGLSAHSSRKASPPKIRQALDGITITRSEFSGTITNGANTGAYILPQSSAIPGWDLNPSSALLFPWLSGFSNLYERFSFLRVTFRFVASQAATTSGKIYAGFDYDYDDTPAATPQVLMSNVNSVSANVWESFSLALNPKQLHPDIPFKYINAGGRNFVEPRTAFCGFLQVMTNCPAQCVWDLWVDYEIKLICPILESYTASQTAAPTYAATNVVGAAGSGFLGLLNLPQRTGVGTPTVVPAAAGPPLSPALSFGTLTPTTLIDTIGATLTDIFRVGSGVTVTGSSLNSLAGNAPSMATFLYDTAGSFLGLGETGGRLGPGVISPNPPSSVTTSGGLLQSEGTYSLKTLRSLFPTLRYILPMLNGPAALGAGSLTPYLQW